jgi:hypothetical protein
VSTQGPYLYDDGPSSLHTGTPRRRRGLLLALFGATIVVAVLMVVTLPLIKGTPAKQARDTVGVFLRALAAHDSTTTHQMLCTAEQTRVPAADVAGTYGGALPGRVVGSTESRNGGTTVERVDVRWADGHTTRISVIGENGPHLCGATPGG